MDLMPFFPCRMALPECFIDCGPPPAQPTPEPEEPEEPPPEPEVQLPPPLDDAVYVAAQDAIFAVSGGLMYKLNKDTGAVLGTATIRMPVLSYSSLVLNSDGYLYFGYWNDPLYGVGSNDKFIYKIDPADMSAVPINLDITGLIGASPYTNKQTGVWRMLASGGHLYFALVSVSGGTNGHFVWFNPATFAPPATGYQRESAPNNVADWFGMAEDTGHTPSWIWMSERDGTALWAWQWDGATSIPNQVAGNVTPIKPTSVAYSPSNSRLYCGTAGQYIQRFTAVNPPVNDATIDTGRASFVGLQARYNAVDGKIYVAGYNDNTVAVITPGAPDTVVVKTGFDLPFDLVFTPTKAFAVQHGKDGLKEIV